MIIAKLVVCGALAISSLAIFRIAINKSWEYKFYKSAVIAFIAFKFVFCIAIYAYFPQLNRTSDAALYYYPQTVQFIEGHLPYRDFPSSYSILFLPLLSVAVSAWNSLGSIALLMLLFETGMITLYLRRCHRVGYRPGWQAAFLYLFSPISFYWISVAGYNGSIISFFTVAALLAAEKGRHFLSGVLAAMGLAFSKLLAALAWPAIVFFDRKNSIRRLTPLILLIAIHAGLLIIGLDVLAPIKNEFEKASSGNIWFLLSVVAPGLKSIAIWKLMPLLLFALGFAILFVLRARRTQSEHLGNFDSGMAFAAATFVLFLICSRKSFTMYLPMALIFVMHTLVTDGKFPIGRLFVLAYIGTVTIIEPVLMPMIIRDGTAVTRFDIILAASLDLPIIGSYIYLLSICLRQLLRYRVSATAP
ncbi:MAG: hypothetical protein A2W25_13845 [candidate division Zixibacteria bacterium RBG_16_53_22]|nr:MAG: hypothetical protein A2W25_13845 [candidate division Zixibacteria bacterium RBG_16_53_22]